MEVSFKFDGLGELKSAFDDLKRATQKNVARRALTKAAEPFRLAAIALVPVRTEHLKDSIIVSTKLTAHAARDAWNETASFSEVHFGPSSDGTTGVLHYATNVEFGTRVAKPHPYMRPAWDANIGKALPILAAELRIEIDKAVARAERKAARLK